MLVILYKSSQYTEYIFHIKMLKFYCKTNQWCKKYYSEKTFDYHGISLLQQIQRYFNNIIKQSYRIG